MDKYSLNLVCSCGKETEMMGLNGKFELIISEPKNESEDNYVGFRCSCGNMIKLQMKSNFVKNRDILIYKLLNI